MPTYYAGSTIAVAAANGTNVTSTLNAKAASASRLQIVNAANGIVFARITNSTDNTAATTADVPIVVTQNNPFIMDKKPGDDKISIFFQASATGTVYVTGADGYQ